MLAEMKADMFKGREGTVLEINTPQGPIRTVLMQVREMPQAYSPRATRLPFSLLMKAAPHAQVPSSLYQLRDPKLGTIDGLYLSPVMAPEFGPPGHAMYYEAVFS
ncbi:DUF6916 family protein [Rhodospirillum sp. A1_3_36]|jgi:hypothetical protein|uniref:DUF6916 family protein n=1 Tax=Rhodospirillum sp. A1_3_36 TaxID=3391666 RepID=UPI0039A5D806